jgi:hypothetical protein
MLVMCQLQPRIRIDELFGRSAILCGHLAAGRVMHRSSPGVPVCGYGFSDQISDGISAGLSQSTVGVSLAIQADDGWSSRGGGGEPEKTRQL